ncbi:MAG: type II toxin-antitoxin system VapC family toxin [Stellaceae bacterium]
MTCYLDPSVVLPTLVKEPTSPSVDAFMSTVEQELLVSDFAAAEVASALSRLVRTGRLNASEGAACLADFDVWRATMTTIAEVHAADIRLACVYVRRFDLALRTPDAVHLAITHRLGVALVTLDRRMAAAARELGVAIETPSSI